MRRDPPPRRPPLRLCVTCMVPPLALGLRISSSSFWASPALLALDFALILPGRTEGHVQARAQKAIKGRVLRGVLGANPCTAWPTDQQEGGGKQSTEGQYKGV